jgi:hypothetical protein
MNRDSTLVWFVMLCALLAVVALKRQHDVKQPAAKPLNPKSLFSSKENPRARSEYEFAKVANPETGEIPKDIRRLELEYAETLPVSAERGLENITWTHRGPFNVGGRTRALALDISDASEQTILAGGVSGGMWRSVNGGASWTKTTSPSQLQNVTCLAQDTRTGKTNIWYHGSGEYSGNSASGGAASYSGDGVFKSTDGGQSWFQLASTVSNTPQTFDNLFDYVWNVAVDASNTTQDEVYVAAYSGIFRSTDGGANWTQALSGLGSPNQAQFSDVAVTSTGVVYATMSDNSTSTEGIFRSTDGVSWTNITPAGFSSSPRRIVIGVAPSNENIVYFLAETPGAGKQNTVDNEWASFWRYDASSNTWANRSANIPAFGGDVGNFNSQGSYNLVVKVKPDNSNFVLIGGTNLYRSTDGFATSANTTWIGGYATANDISVYANHHPDQHSLAFYRNASRSNWLLSGNDNGVSRTTNITAATVSWESLRNGYLTTQFYSVAIRKSSGDNNIIGGKQDNGTYRTTSTSGAANWQNILSGDGAFCAVSSSGNPYYVSAQNGVIYRTTLDANGVWSNWTRITPTGASGFLFIAPFVLDENNSNLMYLPAGSTLWRNTNLTGIPNFSNNTTSSGWTNLNVNAGGTISAVATSTTTPTNRVYYGTTNGRVFRLENANTGSPTPVDIWTGKGFPSNAYVSSIAVDPSNASNAMVVFSNYSVVSLFYTSDAGANWTAVAGNLEQNSNGSGNGPSCRWASIHNVAGGRVFLVGTSAGLYATSALNGMSTVWARQGESNIGRSVVNMIAARQSDGLVAVATHGNGLFSGTITSTLSAPEPTLKAQTFSLSQNYPNPFNPSTTIDYRLSFTGDVKLEVFDMVGRKVSTLVNARQSAGFHRVTFQAKNLASGTYLYRLQSNGEKGQNFVETKKMTLVK